MKEVVCTDCKGVSCFNRLLGGRTKFDTNLMRVENKKEKVKDCPEKEKDTEVLIMRAGSLT